MARRCSHCSGTCGRGYGSGPIPDAIASGTATSPSVAASTSARRIARLLHPCAQREHIRDERLRHRIHTALSNRALALVPAREGQRLVAVEHREEMLQIQHADLDVAVDR